jgi:Cu/Ag efflux pump CusA
VVFSGLGAATVLSLFVVPVVYRIVKGWELRQRRSNDSPVMPG